MPGTRQLSSRSLIEFAKSSERYSPLEFPLAPTFEILRIILDTFSSQVEKRREGIKAEIVR
jgi:hypothetical protein